MIIKIDYLSGIAVYRQIMNTVKEEIASGSLKKGDELPSVRALSLQIKVNPNTVARAYRELLNEGLVYSRQGMGFYVRASDASEWNDVKELLKKAVIEAKVKGVSRIKVEKFFLNELNTIYGQSNAKDLKNSDDGEDNGYNRIK